MSGRREKTVLKAAQMAEVLKSNKTDSKRATRLNFKNDTWYQSVYRNLAVSAPKNRELPG